MHRTYSATARDHPAASPAPRPANSMRTRVISAVVGAPLVLAAVLWPGSTWPFPGWPFALFVLALVLAGMREFYDGCREAGLLPRDGFGFAAGVLFLITATPLFGTGSTLQAFGVTVLVVVSLVVEALRPDRTPLRSLTSTWLGAVYVGWLFPFALRLRLISPEIVQGMRWEVPYAWMQTVGEGALLVLFTMVVTSAVDTGAYLFGRTLGKHKLAPDVSPGKTWEGSVGGFLTAVVVAALLAWWMRLPMTFAVVAAVAIGVVAQLGDLSKSAIKREIGIKDFGTLIPGHGGVLDRFDSLLFTAPAVYWLLVFWPKG